MTLTDLKQTTGKAISEATPITAALCLTLCYVCYWIGSEQAANRVRLDNVETTQGRLITVVEQLADVAKTNTARLNALDDRP